MSYNSTWIMQFPGNFNWSNAALVTKGMAPYGAVALGEIDEVCERLLDRQQEPDAWEEEWCRMGSRLEKVADAMDAAGHTMSAGNYYLRAGMYYFTGERFIYPGERKREIGRKSIDLQTKGLLRRYLVKMTGMSRAQMTRLIGQYGEGSEVKAGSYQRHRFASKYTRADMALLASVDEAHETLSGPATRQILRREYSEYGQAGYERLARISVAQIYRLRKKVFYRQRRLHFTKTRPTPHAIGERRRPEPAGRPGYLRVDTVHQGDREGRACITSMRWMK